MACSSAGLTLAFAGAPVWFFNYFSFRSCDFWSSTHVLILAKLFGSQNFFRSTSGGRGHPPLSERLATTSVKMCVYHIAQPWSLMDLKLHVLTGKGTSSAMMIADKDDRINDVIIFKYADVHCARHATVALGSDTR